MRKRDLDEDGQPVFKEINSARLSDRAVDELIGLCRGVMADGQVNMLEVESMHRWITANEAHASQWPFDVIFERLEDVLDDGVLDEDEQRDLLDLLVDVTGGEIPIEERVASYATSLPLTRPAPELVFPGRRYCLTGKFIYGSRKKCETAVAIRGGITTSTVSAITDYLVVGSMGSPQWLHSTHGTKIEAARFHDIPIVHEGHWCDWIEQTPEAFFKQHGYRGRKRKNLTPGQEVFSAATRVGNPLGLSDLIGPELEELAISFERATDFLEPKGFYAITYTGPNPILRGSWFIRLVEDDPDI